MANTVNTAVKYSKDAVESTVESMVTAPFVTMSVEFTSAKSFHRTGLQFGAPSAKTTTGFGAPTDLVQTDQEFSLSKDYEDAFLTDIREKDESNGTLDATNIVREYQKQAIAPQMDKDYFAQVSKYADGSNDAVNADFDAQSGMVINETAVSITKDNVYSKFQNLISQGSLRILASQGGLIVYVSTDVMNKLAISTELNGAAIRSSQIVENGKIKTRVIEIDGISVIEVVDPAKFKDSDAKPMNMLAAAKGKVFSVLKFAKAMIQPEGTHTEGFGDFIAIRNHWDTFVEGNPANGKYDAAAYSADLT